MSYEFDGVKYKEASTHQNEWGCKLISELGLAGNERILDLGCGDGAITALLAEAVPDGSVLGIDASQGMIAATDANERSNLEFALLDINEMDFVGEFDVVFSNATLHWVKNHPQMLHKTNKALKPGGLARFNFAAKGNCENLFAALDEVMASDRFVEKFADFIWPWYMPAGDEYRRLVVRLGFRTAKVWDENADRHFPDVEAMIRWIDQPSLVPFLPALDEADARDFRDAVVEQMVARCQGEDGRCFETFRRINLRARK